jgi:hypothetical protein
LIGPDSRYAGCILYVDSADEFLGRRERIDTTPEPEDVFHTVSECDRVDLLAYRYLGRADLWWVICDYNDVFFPLDVPVGTVLRIPSAERVAMGILA